MLTEQASTPNLVRGEKVVSVAPVGQFGLLVVCTGTAPEGPLYGLERNVKRKLLCVKRLPEGGIQVCGLCVEDEQHDFLWAVGERKGWWTSSAHKTFSNQFVERGLASGERVHKRLVGRTIRHLSSYITKTGTHFEINNTRLRLECERTRCECAVQ
uniref:Uncharacterized protein n=1 Tax=Marseillevirus LCMAC103 TaxID=2506604 RepID=A0A481YW06_9VIRU|nr:MAG: hypothetical protein LCMAC103_04430 [Marseillevirus LCMAC103]